MYNFLGENMLKYEMQEDKIIIYGKSEFNPKHILECGQFFRYFKIDEGRYVAISGDVSVLIEEVEDGFILHTKNPSAIKRLFNLDEDYAKIKAELVKDAVISKVLPYAEGLRIMKTELFETICSFIISANNNIKRIKLIIERLCKAVGRRVDDYYAFPTIEDFRGLDEVFFRSIGAGFRAKYLAELYENYNEFIKEDVENLTTEELRARLMQFKGVGRKVADCILLFAYNRMDVFPVDVWMERVYYENFGSERVKRDKIPEILVNRFGNLSGYAQQFLFYYKTVAEKENKTK